MIGIVQLQDLVEKWHFENKKLHIKVRISLKRNVGIVSQTKKQKVVENQGKVRNSTS